MAIAPALLLVAALFAPDPEARAQAARHFAQGETAYQVGDYDRALSEFRIAMELAPHDKVRFNIAICLEGLGRYREAVAQYDSAAASEILSADEKRRALDYATQARKHLGTLRFEGAPGSEAVVDDTLHCTVPCGIELDPGPHRYVVDNPPLQGERAVGAGELVVIDVPSGRPPPKPVPTRVLPSKPRRPVDKPPRKARPSALMWTGVGLAALGGAGIIGFGVRARGLRDEYEAMPTADTRDRGILMRNLANASIGVAALGGVLIIADAIRIGVRSRR